MLGAKKRTLAGFSAAAVQPHQGFVSACEVVQHTPPALRPRAVRLVAGKCALLARVDAYAQDPSGSVGASMKARAAACGCRVSGAGAWVRACRAGGASM